MQPTIPRRRFWLVLGVETLALLALAAWVLARLGQLTEPTSLLVGALIVLSGDIATALVMQRFAPTGIVVEPGERGAGSALVVRDFDASGRGRVVSRGESWQARSANGSVLPAGSRVRILAREGLVLVVEPVD